MWHEEAGRYVKKYDSGIVRAGARFPGTFTAILNRGKLINGFAESMDRGGFATSDAAKAWCDSKDALGEKAWE